MAKSRVGLQKEVSRIFTGVQVPKDNKKQETNETGPAPARYIPSKPIPPGPGTGPQPHRPVPATQAHPSRPGPASVPKAIKVDTGGRTSREIPFLKTLERIKDKLLAPKGGVDSKRQKVMMLLVPVLFVVLIVVFSRVLRSGQNSVPKAGTFKPSAAAAMVGAKLNWEIPPLYPTTLRDPMQLYTVRSAKQNGSGLVIVKAIVYSEDKPSAVINEEVVFEGDQVQGAKIVKISPDSIEFEKDAKKWTQKVER